MKNKLQKKKVISIIEYIIIILLLIFNLYIITKVLIKPSKTPTLLGYKAFVVLSDSMADKIKTGDIAIVKDKNDVQKDDIIAFKRGDTIVLHRVAEKIGEGENLKYVTKGDVNSDKDLIPVESEDIEGVYNSKIQYIGYALIFLYKYYIYIIAILLIYLLFKVIK